MAVVARLAHLLLRRQVARSPPQACHGSNARAVLTPAPRRARRLMFGPDSGVTLFAALLTLSISVVFWVWVCPSLHVLATVGGVALYVVNALFMAVLTIILIPTPNPNSKPNPYPNPNPNPNPTQVTATTDPGIIPRNTTMDDAEAAANSQSTRTQTVNGTVINLKWCYTCRIWRPPRAAHWYAEQASNPGLAAGRAPGILCCYSRVRALPWAARSATSASSGSITTAPGWASASAGATTASSSVTARGPASHRCPPPLPPTACLLDRLPRVPRPSPPAAPSSLPPRTQATSRRRACS